MVEYAFEPLSPEPEQVDAAADIYRRSFAEPPWCESWTPEGAKAEIQEALARRAQGEGDVFVARSDGQVVAFVIGHVDHAERHSPKIKEIINGGKHFYVRDIATDPAHRRRGIAARLMHVMERHAQALGARDLFGRTRVDNTAQIHQFERQGFRQIHTEEHETGGVKSLRNYYHKVL